YSTTVGDPSSYAGLQRSFEVFTTSFAPDQKVHGYTESCGTSAACSPGTKNWEWEQFPSGRTLNVAEKDKRGNWTARSATEVAVSDTAQIENRTSFRGATDAIGSGALERVDFAYNYSAPVGRPPVQQVQTETRGSVFSPGQNTTISYGHDNATGRLTSVIRTGFTQAYSGGVWATSQRSIGTFYFTKRICTGEQRDDPLGRVLEVHGPCLVSGPGAVDCDVAPLANTPVTQYAYFDANTASNDANQLQSVKRFSQTTGPTGCSSSPALTTSYAGYDARGNPTSVIDE